MCSHTIFKFCLKTRNQKTSLLNCLFQLCKNANLVKQPKAHVVIRLLGLLLCFFLGSSWSSCHLGGSNRGCHSEGRRVSQEGLNLQEERRSSSKEPMTLQVNTGFDQAQPFFVTKLTTSYALYLVCQGEGILRFHSNSQNSFVAIDNGVGDGSQGGVADLQTHTSNVPHTLNRRSNVTLA